MSFVCTAGDFPPEVVNGQVIVPVGYDDSEPLNYSILMGFEPMAGGDSEFYWFIACANTDTGEVTEYWSGLETKGLFERVCRIMIRLNAITALEALLAQNKPAKVFCCTHDSDAPEKSLYKHMLIAGTFETCGYEVVRQPSMLGKESWWMELIK